MASVSSSAHSEHDTFLEEPSAMMAPPQAIHRCLKHIWKRLGLRARLFLLEADDLVLKDCAGAYECCPEIGLKVNPHSMVWHIFSQGTPANLTELPIKEERPHTLPQPVSIKAVIPLVGKDLQDRRPKSLGVLVVDAGPSLEPISGRDFQYLELLGMLITEILQRARLLEKIRKVQQDKEKLALDICHICRNRFTSIGGLARRLRESVPEPKLKQRAELILEEVEKVEQALEKWRKIPRGEE